MFDDEAADEHDNGCNVKHRKVIELEQRKRAVRSRASLERKRSFRLLSWIRRPAIRTKACFRNGSLIKVHIRLRERERSALDDDKLVP